jgi:cation:H+ antiporter
MAISIIIFLILAFLIFSSGKRLSIYGDIIAEYSGLGKAWFGLIMMAAVTSLPELTVGISSVTVVGSADLAIGDVLGSCVFNLFILSLLDAFMPGKPLLSKASGSHILAAALSIILIALVGMGMYLPQHIILIEWIGISSLIFIVVYFFSIRIIFRNEQKIRLKTLVEPRIPSINLQKAILYYIFNAVIVVSAAFFLPGIAENISVESGLGESFVATLFLAASTSLPEAAVSLSAIRIGAIDLAVGNLIGSNIFNILILAIDDIFFTKGPLLKYVSDENIISIFSVIIMTAICIAGLTFRSERKRFLMAWDTILISLVYIVNLLLLYYL